MKSTDKTPKGVTNGIWHKGLEHIKDGVIKSMLKTSAYKMRGSEEAEQNNCRTCVQAKPKKPPANGKRIEQSNNVTIYADICDPMLVRSTEERHFFLTMTTAQHRFTRANTLKFRVEAIADISKFIACMDYNSKKSVKRVHTDNAIDFLGMESESNARGIELMTLLVNSPKSSGRLGE